MSNLLGVFGLLCIVTAIAVLAGPAWALLAVGIMSVALAYVRWTWEQKAAALAKALRPEGAK